MAEGLPVGSIVVQFYSKEETVVPAEWSSQLKYLSANPDLGSTEGKVAVYDNSGFFLNVNENDYQGGLAILKDMNLFTLFKRLKLEAIVVLGLYFAPSYDFWILKTNLFEFPRDDDIVAVERISPVKLQNLKNPNSKRKLALDIVSLVLQLVLGVVKFVCAYRAGERLEGVYFLLFNLAIFVLLLVSNALYFDGYRGRDLRLGSFGFFTEVEAGINVSKQLMTFCFLLHAYQTLFSLRLNTGLVYVLTVWRFTQRWLGPLILQYAVAIIIFSFLVDNVIDSFNLSITQAIVAIFRMLANSNFTYWTLIINESPAVFILVVVIVEFWIFYIINNVYFGIQCEIVRLCEIAKKDKTLGISSELVTKIVSLFRKKAPQEEAVPAESK